MQIIIKGKNMDISQPIHEHTTSKIQNLEKFIFQKPGQTILAEIELGLRSRRHRKGDIYRAEINLTVDGRLHRAVAKKGDLLEAIDATAQDVERQIRRDKGKKDSLMRRGARKAKDILRGFRR